MAVSRTFLRGMPSSTSTSLMRSVGAGASASPMASTSRCVLASVPNGVAATAPFSILAPRAEPKRPHKLENIKMPADELERMQDSEDVGHDMTGGRVGRHAKRTLSTFSMAGKVCVVTGAARGLGNLMARTFIESGASKVAFLDLSAEEAEKAAVEARQWFEEHGDADEGELELMGVKCDVSDEASVKAAFAKVHDRWGAIHTVVNSAGIVENFPAQEYPTDKFRKLMSINLDGAWYVANEAARFMVADKTKGGSIVLIASMSASIVNYPQLQTPYNASKAGVKHLAASLGVEWAKHGIRVNSLSPGYMLTNLTRVMIEKSEHGKMLKREWEARTPMGRMGEPEDLKGAAIFLASDASKFVTSSDVIVDGGYCAL